MKKQLSTCLLATAAALSIGFAANSFAAPPEGRPGPGPGWGMMGGGPGHHMMSGKGMNRLHEELKLDAKQEALWKDAEQFGREHRQSMFDRFRKHHDEIKGMIDQPGADLRAVAKRMDDFRDEGAKERTAMRDRWLAVYDSFNPDQKEKARVFFKDRMERMEHFGKEKRGYHGRRGQPANPPPAN